MIVSGIVDYVLREDNSYKLLPAEDSGDIPVASSSAGTSSSSNNNNTFGNGEHLVAPPLSPLPGESSSQATPYSLHTEYSYQCGRADDSPLHNPAQYPRATKRGCVDEDQVEGEAGKEDEGEMTSEYQYLDSVRDLRVVQRTAEEHSGSTAEEVVEERQGDKVEENNDMQYSSDNNTEDLRVSTRHSEDDHIVLHHSSSGATTTVSSSYLLQGMRLRQADNFPLGVLYPHLKTETGGGNTSPFQQQNLYYPLRDDINKERHHGIDDVLRVSLKHEEVDEPSSHPHQYLLNQEYLRHPHHQEGSVSSESPEISRNGEVESQSPNHQHSGIILSNPLVGGNSFAHLTPLQPSSPSGSAPHDQQHATLTQLSPQTQEEVNQRDMYSTTPTSGMDHHGISSHHHLSTLHHTGGFHPHDTPTSVVASSSSGLLHSGNISR
ncbi:uncharacterized protein [Anabrus simplex]|uniref:uncharacterized protein n=1 Tax=Anabrus simplex TaxID=316456 RepID=UPI0035A2CCF3